MHGRLPLAFLAGATLVGLPVVAWAADPAPTASREDLAQRVSPVGAPDRTLGLARVTVPPGVALAPHVHRGTQIAYIDKGTLTFTVRRGGTVRVMRGDAVKGARVVRRIGPGQSGPIRTGEWIVESPSVVHFGANRGKTEVVIYVSTLFEKGAPSSVPVPG